MTATFIVKCIKCGGYMLCNQDQKTKICPYCGTNVNLKKTKAIASAATAFEASEILRRLKNERGFGRQC